MRAFIFLILLTGLHFQTTQAHHSFATHYSYDDKLVIYGVITKLRLANPHSFFSVDVTRDDGHIETWEVEANSIPLLARADITHGTFKVGERIKVTGMRSRDAKRKLMFGLVGEKENGDEYFFIRPDWDTAAKPPVLVRGQKARLDTTKLAGIWKRIIRDGEIMNTSGESPLPLNDAGLIARGAYNPLESQFKDCTSPDIPALLYLPYLIRIDVDGDRIDMFHEYYEVLRRFNTDGEIRQVHSTPQHGVASATLEGGAFIIESSLYPAMQAGLGGDFGPLGRGKNIPSSEQKRIYEAYRLLNDDKVLEVTLTIEDPVYLTEKFETTLLWERAPQGMDIIPFDCEVDIAQKSTRNAVTD